MGSEMFNGDGEGDCCGTTEEVFSLFHNRRGKSKIHPNL